MSEEKCVFWVQNQVAYGKIEHQCGKVAVKKDSHGRALCQKHYNKWEKKVNKGNAKPR